MPGMRLGSGPVETLPVAPTARARELEVEAIVPVTSFASATFGGMAAATGSRAVIARPSVKLITPTTTAAAPAAAKTVILCITLFPKRRKLPLVPDRHIQPKLVNVRFPVAVQQVSAL